MAESEQHFEINRENYDRFNEERLRYKAPEGITEELVREISRSKDEPEWMLNIRLKGLEMFHKLKMPDWGPSLEKLDLSQIHYYMRPDANKNSHSWEDVPQDIKDTFDKLGIPEAEKHALGGVGAQYESEVVYHNLKKELVGKGVVFLDCDEAVKQHPELVKEYFMTSCVPVGLHKFSALHAAVWSGGTFIYVPKGVKVDQPLQAYFRMNAQKGGQFEHTLIIVDEGAEVSYIEGCFVKGTQIMTLSGEKNIEEVTTTDMVLTSEGVYKQVSDVQKRPHKGKIANIQVWGDSTQTLSVTDDHPFLYVYRKRQNEKNATFKPEWNMPHFFKKGDYLCLPIDQEELAEEIPFSYRCRVEQNNDFVSWPITPSKELFRLIGYYLAEGSISNNSYLNFSFHTKEVAYQQDVISCVKKVFGIDKYRLVHHTKNNGTSVVFSSVDLARIFSVFGKGAANKFLPIWVRKAKKVYQKEMLKTWFYGDGNYFKRKLSSGLKESFRISTVSEQLAKQMRHVCFRLGIVPSINVQKRKSPRREMYTLSINGGFVKKFGDIVNVKTVSRQNGKHRASMFGIDKKFVYVPIKSIELVQKTTTVYNFGVEDHHTYTANGLAVHNCSAPQYTQNSLHAGCVEIHVLKGARARYSSIENWSKNTFNLNTKRAVCSDDAVIEWINGNMGSGVTMLYPASVLRGDRSKSDFIGIALANKDQHQDTGCKVTHVGKHTSSTITSKSISLNGGISTYRGLVSINKGAKNASVSVECDALMMDNKSQSNTYPYMDVKEKKVTVAHEATVGKINDEQIFYLMSRGLSEEAAKQLIVSGFIEPIVKELPLEYAVELNRLIELEMEGSLG